MIHSSHKFRVYSTEFGTLLTLSLKKRQIIMSLINLTIADINGIKPKSGIFPKKISENKYKIKLGGNTQLSYKNFLCYFQISETQYFR